MTEDDTIKISDLIKILEAARDGHGDLPVLIYDADEGQDYPVHFDALQVRTEATYGAPNPQLFAVLAHVGYGWNGKPLARP